MLSLVREQVDLARQQVEIWKSIDHKLERLLNTMSNSPIHQQELVYVNDPVDMNISVLQGTENLEMTMNNTEEDVEEIEIEESANIGSTFGLVSYSDDDEM